MGKPRKFITKDSGEREEFASGMVRDTQTDKPDYTLIDLPMLTRWAELMTRGAQKYGRENWRQASGEAELTRFKASAFRHLVQWLQGEDDEDHAAAVFFNIAGAEMVKERLAPKWDAQAASDYVFEAWAPDEERCTGCDECQGSYSVRVDNSNSLSAGLEAMILMDERERKGTWEDLIARDASVLIPDAACDVGLISEGERKRRCNGCPDPGDCGCHP